MDGGDCWICQGSVRDLSGGLKGLKGIRVDLLTAIGESGWSCREKVKCGGICLDGECDV